MNNMKKPLAPRDFHIYSDKVTLSSSDQREIGNAVKKVVKEYGETLRLLGRG